MIRQKQMAVALMAGLIALGYDKPSLDTVGVVRKPNTVPTASVERTAGLTIVSERSAQE
jgi:hypothetical protein